MRVLTPLPDELPEEDPECVLVRVLTGLPADPEAAEDVLCDGLVLVVTGAAAYGVAAVEWEALVRVVTGAPAAATADPPIPCDLLAPVRGAPAAPPAYQPLPERAPCPAPAPAAAGRCLTMWIVRRITWVRTSAAGLRAATVATVSLEGRSAHAASTPAARAVIPAAIRVYLLRMLGPPVRGLAPMCPSLGDGPVNPGQRFGKAHQA